MLKNNKVNIYLFSLLAGILIITTSTINTLAETVPVNSVGGEKGVYTLTLEDFSDWLITPSMITPSTATPSTATPSTATPSTATPSTETPSTATPSMATPSMATPSMAEKTFIRIQPREIPKYYNQTSIENKVYWEFKDRNETIQYRDYGYIQGDTNNPQWFAFDRDGNVEQPIDLDKEYYSLAPYIYESSEPESTDIDNVVKMDFGANYDWFTYKTVANEGNKTGLNWDGSCYNLIKVKIGIIDRELKDKGTDRYYFFGKIKNKNDSDKEDSSDDYSDFWQSGDLELSLFDLSLGDIKNQESEESTEENEQKSNEWYRSGEDFIVRSKVTTSPLITMMRGPLPNIGPINYSYQADWYSGLLSNPINGRHPQTSQRYNYTTQSGFSAYIGAYYAYSSYRQKYYFEIYGEKGKRNDPNTQVPVFNVDCTENITVEFPTADNFHQDAYWLCRDIDGEALSFDTGDSDYSTKTFKGLENGKYSVYRYEYGESEDDNGGWSGGRSYTFSLNNIHRGNGSVVSTNATCTSPGSKTVYYPECGHYNTEYSPALGHDYSAQYTYKTDGYHYKYCPRDGAVLDKQPNTYTVSYNSNGGSGSIGSVTHTFATNMALAGNTFTRTGHVFKGWNTKSDGLGTPYSNGQVVSNLTGTQGAVITLYAQWEPIKYQLNLDGNGGTINGHSNKIENIAYGTSYDINLKNGQDQASKVGYTFDGWHTLPQGGISFPDSGNVMQDSNLTVYAHWKVNKYKLILDGNGGMVDGHSNKIEDVEYGTSYDENLKNGQEQASRVGYTFDGWYTLPQDGSVYSDSGNMMQDSNLTVYAHWKVNKYHVRLLGNHNGLDEIIAEYDVTYDTKLGTLPDLEVPGYTFLGWFDNKENEITSDSWAEAHDVDYKAHWRANQYSIFFEKNLYLVSENPEPKNVIYDEKIGELPLLIADGYSFLGWYTEPVNGEKIEETTPVEIGDVTYYAHWDKNDYILKLVTDEATLNGVKEIPVTFDNEIGILPIPHREDFIFKGWFEEPYSKQSNLHEGILLDYASPSEATRINEDTIYKKATSSEAYAYFDLMYREESGNRNIRSGNDGKFDTNDDNYYFNGQDGLPGTSDDCKINAGPDKIFGTEDDYYEFNGFKVYPGPDKIFGTLDDYMDLCNGTNLRPGESNKWDNETNFPANNGYDNIPGTRDDWIWYEIKDGTIRKPGVDGIFFTLDDEIWWIGKDGVPGSEDDKLINDNDHGGGFIDNGDGTNTRPGPDGKFGTDDDELWWNGKDGIPGNEDDKLIHKGMDKEYGTRDDYIDNEDGTNTRPGPDLKFGTDDDEIWRNGKDGIPGNEDDVLVKYDGSSSDFNSNNGRWVYDPIINNWLYEYSQNSKIVNSWAYLRYRDYSSWYRFDQNGVMQTGWLDENGKQYYLHEISDGTRGHMYTGWKEIQGNWYYFNDEKLQGNLLTNTITPDGYKVNEQGVWIK